jgi:hypothetical protein
MKRTGFALFGLLATYPLCAAAQESPIDPRLIGAWQNSGKGGACGFFPVRINLTKNYVPKTSPYTGRIVEGFLYINADEMTYWQLGPDARDTCRFVKISRQP